MISTVTSTQIDQQLSPIVNKIMTHLCIYVLRNYGYLEYVIEEMSTIYDNNTLLQTYHEAVSESYAFLDLHLMKRDKQ